MKVANTSVRSAKFGILERYGRSRVGQDIKARRKELGFTLEHVAKCAKTHKGYISGIENGNVSPPAPKMMMRICTVLKLNIKVMLIKSWVEKAPIAIMDEAVSMSLSHV